MTSEQREQIIADLRKLELGDQLRFTVHAVDSGTHEALVMRTNKEGFHAGRPRYLVACEKLIQHVHALNHVLAVFEHDDRMMAAVAEWFPTKHRWNYETISGLAARFSYWPDGQDPLEKHESAQGGLCACCSPGAKDVR